MTNREEGASFTTALVVWILILLFGVITLIINTFIEGSEKKRALARVTNLKKWLEDRELTIFLLSKGIILPPFYFPPPGLRRIIYRKLLLIYCAGDREKDLLAIIDGKWKGEQIYFFALGENYFLELTYLSSSEKIVRLVYKVEMNQPATPQPELATRPLNEREGKILVIHPGEILRKDFFPAFAPQRTVEEWAENLKTDPKRLHNLLAEKEDLDGDMVVRLATRFGTSVKFWFDLSLNYELSTHSKKHDKRSFNFDKELAKEIADLEAKKQKNN